MKMIEMCAGAGGMTLGLHRAGITTRLAIEYDSDAAATWQAAFDAPMHVGDAREVDFKPHRGQASLLAGGVPCQPFSAAGKRAGENDSRNLWPTFVRAIDECDPTWVLIENVMGLTSHSAEAHARRGEHPCPGCYLEKTILPELRARFAWVAVWKLNAADFGCPQVRRRIFIVAGPRKAETPRPTHSQVSLVREKWVTGEYWKRIGQPCPIGKPSPAEERLVAELRQPQMFRPRAWSLKAWTTVRETLSLDGLLGGMRNTDNHPGQERDTPTEEPAPTVGGRGAEILTPRPAWALPGGKHPDVQLDDPCPTIRNAGEKYFGQPGGALRVIGGGRNPQSAELADTRNYRDITDEPSITMTAEQVGNRGPWLETRAGTEPERLDIPSPTVATTEVKGTRASAASGGTFSGGPDRASDAMFLATGRRRLTTDECARLQAFPDDHPWQGNKTQIYRQIGNAVPPALAEAVGRVLLAANGGIIP